MSAHTTPEDKEMTTEEFETKLMSLRSRQRNLLADPITKENIIALVYLLAEYIELGSQQNANELHIRIGNRRAVLSGLSIASPAPVTEQALPAGRLL